MWTLENDTSIVVLLASLAPLSPKNHRTPTDPRSAMSLSNQVVIDAFRLINPQLMMLGQEPRQTTSNIGHLNKPSVQVSNAS